MDQPKNTSKDQLHVPNGPMTWSKTKALKEEFNALVLNVSTMSELKGLLEYQEETQRNQKNPTTTWKQHGWLPFLFVSRIKGLHARL